MDGTGTAIPVTPVLSPRCLIIKAIEASWKGDIMPNLATVQGAADFLADIDFDIAGKSRGDFSPQHIAYSCNLSKGDAAFGTTFQSNPQFNDAPTVADVLGSLSSEAMLAHDYGIDEFADEMGYTKPSAAIRAYEGCKRSLDWLHDGLDLSFEDIRQLSETLDGHADEVGEAVEAIHDQRAAEKALTSPELPKGFVTIDSLETDLDLGDFGEQCPDYSDDYITDAIQSVADENVDIYHHDLLKWLPDNYEWIEEANAQGLLEGCEGDLMKMAQTAQYVCFSQDMYDHQEDIAKYATLEALKDAHVYAISDELADALMDDIDYAGANTFSGLLDDAKEQIQNVMAANLAEALGDEDRAEEVAEELVENDDYTANPCALSVAGVREVNEKDLEAAIACRWNDSPSQEAGQPSLASAAKECRAASDALGDDAPGGHGAPGHDEH